MIYENTSYGVNGAVSIEEESKESNVCFALKVKLSDYKTDKEFKRFAEILLKNINNNGMPNSILL